MGIVERPQSVDGEEEEEEEEEAISPTRSLNWSRKI
jgi:hypothetical protein